MLHWGLPQMSLLGSLGEAPLSFLGRWFKMRLLCSVPTWAPTPATSQPLLYPPMGLIPHQQTHCLAWLWSVPILMEVPNAPDRPHGVIPIPAPSPPAATAVSSLKWAKPCPVLSHLLLICEIICFATLHASKRSRHPVTGLGESPEYLSYPKVKNVKIKQKWRKCGKMICY